MYFYDDRHIKSYSEGARLVTDVAKALTYLHTTGYVHRDVKRSNVRFSGQSAVLVDFDLSCAWREGDPPLKGRVGTTGWHAPEIVRGDSYSSAIDVWGLGLVLLDEILQLSYDLQGSSFVHGLKFSFFCS